MVLIGTGFRLLNCRHQHKRSARVQQVGKQSLILKLHITNYDAQASYTAANIIIKAACVMIGAEPTHAATSVQNVRSGP